MPKVILYDVLSESEYENAMNEFGQYAFTVGNGAEGIKNVLSSMDLKVELVKIQNLIQNCKRITFQICIKI